MNRLQTKGLHFYAGDQKWLARGVTYGPFEPDRDGNPYPDTERLEADFGMIRELGANCLRLYALPTEELARAAERHGLYLFIDLSWPKHVDVYGDKALQRKCLALVEEEVRRVRDWPNVAGVFVANEIPPDLVRWSGSRKVERFLKRLYARARDLAPDLLIGYANFPSVEYLNLHFFDFVGFNVYLEDPGDFREYVTRLRHLYPEKPLLISEIGLDSQSHGEEAQAGILSADLCAAYEAGASGAVVFAWTDEWHVGGYEMDEWSFGLVDGARRPKKAYWAVKEMFDRAPQCRLADDWPKVSVVVATYNGAHTLRDCLNSLERIRYPSYEVIVVDDGSTDETPEILETFSGLRMVRQPNRGLSAARNAGIEAATGEIVAFTDSDCVADEDWLYHLVATMRDDGLDGVGGPNLTPPSKKQSHQAVGLAPGHATHVLLSMGEAEHVPGCNMAFRHEALLAAGAFDPVFRKAGDDVDVVWRLREEGYRIGFSPGGFVWHHRRPTVRAYWKQQMGYGEAEALLLEKHPHRFNDRGQSMWRGTIYPLQGLKPLFGRPNVHYGVFGSAGYQCIYERKASRAYYLVTSLEWWCLCVALAGMGLLAALPALYTGLAGIALSLAVSARQAWRNWVDNRGARSHGGFLLVWVLWATQPVVREASRYRARMRSQRPSEDFERSVREIGNARRGRPLGLSSVLEYWSDDGEERLQVLRRITERITKLRWPFTVNSPWEAHDLSVSVSGWFRSRVVSAEENHGEGKRLLRLRFRLVPTSQLWIVTAGGLILCGAVALQNTVVARMVLVGLLLALWFTYRNALKRRQVVEELADGVIQGMGFIPIGERAEETQTAADCTGVEEATDFRGANVIEGEIGVEKP